MYNTKRRENSSTLTPTLHVRTIRILTMPPSKSSQAEGSKVRYPPIVWAADSRRLVHQLFTVLEENSSIRKGIWPRKGEHGSKSKSANYKSLARKLFPQESEIGDRL